MEALKMARSHRPDLILMDIQLPEVYGLEVTKWLKEDDELRAIPVVAVTAFAMKGDEEKIREGERKSVVEGKSGLARVDLGGRRIIKKKTQSQQSQDLEHN